MEENLQEFAEFSERKIPVGWYTKVAIWIRVFIHLLTIIAQELH